MANSYRGVPFRITPSGPHFTWTILPPNGPAGGAMMGPAPSRPRAIELARAATDRWLLAMPLSGPPAPPARAAATTKAAPGRRSRGTAPKSRPKPAAKAKRPAKAKPARPTARKAPAAASRKTARTAPKSAPKRARAKAAPAKPTRKSAPAKPTRSKAPARSRKPTRAATRRR